MCMETIRVKSIVDSGRLEQLRMPLVALYHTPEDYPDKWVARIYDRTEALPEAMVEDNLEVIMEDMARSGMTWIDRGRDDVMSLVGCWI